MNSTFLGLSIATRGLYTSQAALLVTNNNISNLNTTGYSRQVVNQSAAGPAAIYSGRGCIGIGSQVTSVDRVHDAQLDVKFWRENSKLGEWEVKSEYLTELESIFGEPSDAGISTLLSNFTSALSDLSQDPDSDSARVALREAGVSICTYLNDTTQRLEALREDANSDVKTTVEQINSYAQQIADLNQRIREASANGAGVNELMDQRGVLIDELSKLVEVDVNEITVGNGESTMLSISVNGAALVNGGNVRELECYQISDGSSQDGMYGIRWADTGDSFAPGSGELQAYLDLRDGTGADSEYQGIPYYISQLNEFARTFAKAFNEGVFKDGTAYYAGHAGGAGSDGSEGIRFFSYDSLSSEDLLASGATTDEAYLNITAANISLSQDIQDDLANIAAASAAGEAGNNENVDELISLCEDSLMFNKGTPTDFMNSIISTLGTSSSYAQRLAGSQSTVIKNIDDRRSSVSGVSTNEETANLTKYQQAYEASAKMMEIWNEIYQETLDIVSD